MGKTAKRRWWAFKGYSGICTMWTLVKKPVTVRPKRREYGYGHLSQQAVPSARPALGTEMSSVRARPHWVEGATPKPKAGTSGGKKMNKPIIPHVVCSRCNLLTPLSEIRCQCCGEPRALTPQEVNRIIQSVLEHPADVSDDMN